MIIADYVAIGVVVLLAILGIVAGFGGGLKFFTGGIFGVIISVIVCYFAYGIVINWQFVIDIMANIRQALTGADNAFCNVLLDIHFEIVAICLAMFIIVQILRIIVVAILKNIVEINNVVFKVINKVLGLALMVGVGIIVALIVFQIIAWIGGNTSVDFANCLNGSVFKLDVLYNENPLNKMFTMFSGQ
jgi:hypothetical protein